MRVLGECILYVTRKPAKLLVVRVLEGKSWEIVDCMSILVSPESLLVGTLFPDL